MTQPKVYSYSRFSSAIQGQGHSLKRQIQRAEKWCEERGFVLEESHADEGKSAYHGDHLSSGALGRFIASIDAGRIPAGSILLIEALDRLTRQNLHEAQGLVWRILNKGIKIVTVADGHEYTKDQGLPGAVMLLITLEASHMESEKKADRLRQSWKERHQKAIDGTVIGKGVPGWMVVTDKGLELVPERVALVREMFALADQGMGVQAIATLLNKRGVPPWKTARHWLKATIHQIITGKATLGILTMKLAGQAVTVPGYFPAIISEGLYYRVQASLKAKTNGGASRRAGRKGGYNNLLSDVGRCGYCGARLAIVDAGTGRNGRVFRHKLACNEARLGHGCKYWSVQYQPLEDAIIQYCAEVDYSALLSAGENNALVEAKGLLAELIGLLAGKEAQVESELSLAAMVKSPEMLERLAQRLDAFQADIESIRGDVAEAQREVDRLSRTGDALLGHVETIRQLRAMLTDGDEDARIEARRKMRVAMTEAIESITLFANGLEDRILGYDPAEGFTVRPFLRPDNELDRLNLADHIDQNTGRHAALALMRFRNGHSRVFRWDADSSTFRLDSEDTATALVISGYDFGTIPATDIKIELTPNRRKKIDRFVEKLTKNGGKI